MAKKGNSDDDSGGIPPEMFARMFRPSPPKPKPRPLGDDLSGAEWGCILVIVALLALLVDMVGLIDILH